MQVEFDIWVLTSCVIIYLLYDWNDLYIAHINTLELFAISALQVRICECLKHSHGVWLNIHHVI